MLQRGSLFFWKRCLFSAPLARISCSRSLSVRTGNFYEDAVDGVVSTILEGAAHDKAHRDHRVILAVLVDNDPGVLNKVSGLLSARGFNIESLTVSPTNLEAMSRMTIVIRDATEEKAAQAIKQLHDVVNVLAVVDYTGTNSLHVSQALTPLHLHLRRARHTLPAQ